MPEEDEELAQRWAEQKETRRADATRASFKEMEINNGQGCRELKKYQEKAIGLTTEKSLYLGMYFHYLDEVHQITSNARAFEINAVRKRVSYFSHPAKLV